MKKLLIIVALVIAGIAIYKIYSSRNSESPHSHMPMEHGMHHDKVAGEFDGQTTVLCYLREVPVSTPGASPDVDYLELVASSDTSTLSGFYNWIPSEKDSARGELSGEYDHVGRLLRGTYTYSIEGSLQQQQMNVKFTPEGAYIGEGELVEKTYNPVVLMYKDEDLVKYEKLLPLVGCDTVKPEYRIH